MRQRLALTPTELVAENLAAEVGTDTGAEIGAKTGSTIRARAGVEIGTETAAESVAEIGAETRSVIRTWVGASTGVGSASEMPTATASETGTRFESQIEFKTGSEARSEMAAEIAALVSLDLYGLRVKWRKLMRRPAPEHLNRAILIRIIAYKMQARRFGDLDAKTIQSLEAIARNHDRKRQAGLLKPKAVPEVEPVPPDRGHRAGTMFIREHGGEMHRVTVVHGGFEWRGETYRSLSDIARRITGTTWSGPRFFGLKEPARKDIR